MARILLLLLSATTAGAFKVSRRCAAPARTLLRAADDAATDLQDLMAKQHTSTLDAVATAKKEVYDAYAEKIRALESRVAAAAAVATAAAPGVAEAWSGARDYGWAAQIQEPLDVPKAAVAAVLLAAIMSPGVFGTYQAVRWFAVKRGLVGDDDEDAKQAQGYKVLAANVAIAVAVNSQCLDLGY